MNESVNNEKHHTLLCLITIYVIHGIFLSSGINSVNSITIKNPAITCNMSSLKKFSRLVFEKHNLVLVTYQTPNSVNLSSGQVIALEKKLNVKIDS